MKMINDSDSLNIELICIIVNFGLGSKILQKAKRCGIHGGTVVLGKGTIKNKILDYVGLSDVRKELIFMVTDEKTANQSLEMLNKKFEFDKPNHGMAFTTSICRVAGTRCIKCENQNQNQKQRGADNVMYHAITIIVDKGQGEEVVEAATKAGSKGATIINGRGSGIHETSKLFSMDIEPEKEIIMILSECDKSEAIVSSVREKLKIDEPGNGIIYIQDVNKTYGIYK